MAQNRCDVQELSFDDIVVPDTGLGGGQRLTSQGVHSECFAVSDVSFLDFNEGVLWVETRVLSQSAGNNEKGLGEAHNTKLGLSRNFLAGAAELSEVLASGDFEGATTWNDGLVLNGVLDSAETVTDCILSLSDGVVVGSLDEDSA